jgi:DNA replication protein DnaC
MNGQVEIVPSLVDRIKKSLIGLKMPRAIEILDVTLRRIEQGEVTAIEAIDALLAEELMLRENRRIKTALIITRLSTIKTLASFDFSFQPSLDKNRIMALAQLEFIDRKEVVHLLGPTECDSYCSSPHFLKTPTLSDADCQTTDAEVFGPALLG